MINTTTICDTIENATKKILNVLNCNYTYSYPKTIQTFPYRITDKLNRICSCLEDYEKAQIQIVQNSELQLSINENILAQLNIIINCIDDLVKETRGKMAASICKLLENNPSRYSPIYVTNLPIKYSFDEMIANNAYIRLHDFNKMANSTEILNKVQQISVKYRNYKFARLISNFNTTEHAYILENCRFIFPSKRIYTNMFIIIPAITEMFNSIDNCINASFENIHPELFSLILSTCREIENICGEQSSGEGNNFQLYLQYESVNRNLFKSFIKLSSLAKELEQLAQIILNTNETRLLNTFWHLVSMAIYGKVLFEIYSNEFTSFLNKYTQERLFENNCVHSNVFIQLYHMLDVKHEGLKSHLKQFVTTIKLISKKHQNGVYLRIPNIDNHTVIITLIMGIYNQFLHETKPITP